MVVRSGLVKNSISTSGGDALVPTGSLADPPPIGKLLRPAPVDQTQRAGMADREHAGSIGCDPCRTSRLGNRPGRVSQGKDLSHRPPAVTTHTDDDRRLQIADQRGEMLFGAGVHPAR